MHGDPDQMACLDLDLQCFKKDKSWLSITTVNNYLSLTVIKDHVSSLNINWAYPETVNYFKIFTMDPQLN